MDRLKIGTRGSALALKQADIVQKQLHALYPHIETQIVTIVTSGDKILDKNLALIGGKGLFIKEIEEQLQDRTIDFAVHSMKDMQANLTEIFSIPCVLEREDPRDCFISTKYKSISELPHGTTLGTSSSRRAAQTLALRPDLKIIPFRGNIGTRIKKLEDGLADATFLAVAGLKRINLFDERIMHPLPQDAMLPAVSQGAIGIEILKENTKLESLLSPLNHRPTYDCLSAERSFMLAFEGSCTTPIAAQATIVDDKIYFNALIAKPDGSIILRTSRNGEINEAARLGMDAAMELKKRAGGNFFD